MPKILSSSHVFISAQKRFTLSLTGYILGNINYECSSFCKWMVIIARWFSLEMQWTWNQVKCIALVISLVPSDSSWRKIFKSQKYWKMSKYYKWEKRSLILQFYFLQWNTHITTFLICPVDSKLWRQSFLEHDTGFLQSMLFSSPSNSYFQNMEIMLNSYTKPPKKLNGICQVEKSSFLFCIIRPL